MASSLLQRTILGSPLNDFTANDKRNDDRWITHIVISYRISIIRISVLIYPLNVPNAALISAPARSRVLVSAGIQEAALPNTSRRILRVEGAGLDARIDGRAPSERCWVSGLNRIVRTF
jgi:hypothetical protein